VGYLGCDEFAMLEPVIEWINTDEKPFFMTYLCSVTHDPYDVPEWFEEPAKEQIDKYKQAIFYTDKFLAALDVELNRLNIADNTIFCIVGDHGEAFGEHGQLGHAFIHFDEVLHIPFCIRAPFFIEPGTVIKKPVSSIDLTPTLLSMLGLHVKDANFDGDNVLGDIPEGRKVYFSGWMQEGPAGYVQDNRKIIYNPTDKMVYMYDLRTDPFELIKKGLPEQEAGEISKEITKWRRGTILKIKQERTGRKVLFDNWICKWNDRDATAKYNKP
jgi:arylsulfatase A-like enzyme